MSERAMLELKNPITFPVVDGDYEIYVTMRPYPADQLKKMLRETATKMAARGKNMIEILNSDPESSAELFFSNFIDIYGLSKSDGTEPSHEAKLAWLKRNKRLAIDRAIVRLGFGGLNVEFEPPADEFNVDATFDMIRIAAYQHFGFLVDGKWEALRVDMSHNLAPEQDIDVKRWEQSQGKSRVHTKSKTFERVIDYDALERCYDGLAISLEGCTVDGKPCDKSNRELWLPLVPLWHKDVVLSAYFRGVEAKND